MNQQTLSGFIWSVADRQTGEAAAKLKQLLSTEELKDLADGGEVGTEDLMAAQMATRANDVGIT